MRYAVSGFGHRDLGDLGIWSVGCQSFALFSSANRCFSVLITGRYLGSDSGATLHHTELSHPSSSSFFARDDPTGNSPIFY